MSTPTSLAGADTVTTMPCLPSTTRSAAPTHAGPTSTSTTTSNNDSFFIGFILTGRRQIRTV